MSTRAASPALCWKSRAPRAPRRETRQYATFPRRLKELGRWLKERGVELAVAGEHRHLLEECLCRPGGSRHPDLPGECPARQTGAGTQDGCGRQRVVGG